MNALAFSQEDAWTQVRRFMERHCGVVMGEDQRYLLESRLQSPARHFAGGSIGEYVRRACGGSPSSVEAKALVEAMTTHETFFFRDPGFWRFLEEAILPQLIAAGRGRPLRIWSAACSTGQEPYSIAALLDEKFPHAAVEIIATDVSELTVERAREGVFSMLEVNRGLGAARLIRHFEKCPGGFRVRTALRERVTFQAHNLLAARPDPGDCDLVLCRNVLIYFGTTDRSAVVRRLVRACSPGGYIGIGTTETLKALSLSPGWYRPELSIG